MTERLFHFVDPAALEERPFAERSEWAPPSLTNEGFVHLSFAHQLAGTLAVHFAETPVVLLAEIDARAVADALVVEVSRGDEAFPHVYRALRPDEFLGWWRLERTNGRIRPPILGAGPGQDRPPGASIPPGA